MYRGRLRKISGLPNGDDGMRHRWTDQIIQGRISTPKENNDCISVSDGGCSQDLVELYSPISSISAASSSTMAGEKKFRYNTRYGYSEENAYEAVYAEKVIVHTVENIITKEPPIVQSYADVHGSQENGRRRGGFCPWWCPWLLIPLLFLLPLLLIGTSDHVRNSVCSVFPATSLPLPNPSPHKKLEITTFKKFYHYFVPVSTQVTSGPSSGSAPSLEDVKKFENLLTSVDSRLESVEDAFKRINVSVSNMSNPKNYTKEVHALRIMFSNLDQRIADLESASISSTSNRKLLQDEILSVKGQMGRLQDKLQMLEQERNSWRDQLEAALVNSHQHQSQLADINLRLDSLARADCDCKPAMLPEGGINKEEVNRLITEAIMHYDADKTGLPDYALEPAGGTILSTRCTETYPSNTREHTFWGIRLPFWARDYSPRTVIQPGLTPGECWAFKGARGYLVIKLSGLIQVTAVSYEHIPKEISPDGNIFSAPKNLEVYALSTEMDQNGTLLGKFTYDQTGTPLQYFPVQLANVPPTEFLELRVTKNHGHPLYTCLYRFRVHGKRMNSGWPSFGGSA